MSLPWSRNSSYARVTVRPTLNKQPGEDHAWLEVERTSSVCLLVSGVLLREAQMFVLPPDSSTCYASRCYIHFCLSCLGWFSILFLTTKASIKATYCERYTSSIFFLSQLFWKGHTFQRSNIRLVYETNALLFVKVPWRTKKIVTICFPRNFCSEFEMSKQWILFFKTHFCIS